MQLPTLNHVSLNMWTFILQIVYRALKRKEYKNEKLKADEKNYLVFHLCLNLADGTTGGIPYSKALFRISHYTGFKNRFKINRQRSLHRQLVIPQKTSRYQTQMTSRTLPLFYFTPESIKLPEQPFNLQL